MRHRGREAQRELGTERASRRRLSASLSSLATSLLPKRSSFVGRSRSAPPQRLIHAVTVPPHFPAASHASAEPRELLAGVDRA